VIVFHCDFLFSLFQRFKKIKQQFETLHVTVIAKIYFIIFFLCGMCITTKQQPAHNIGAQVLRMAQFCVSGGAFTVKLPASPTRPLCSP